MEFYEQRAELAGEMPEQQRGMYPIDPRDMTPAMNEEAMGYIQQPEQDQVSNDMFARKNDLEVIQEYNREENMPSYIKNNFWSLASKSIKLGFWKDEDIQEIFLYKNVIKLGHLMAKPRARYTFGERQAMNQIDMLVFADFKRGVGMEKYKINERTLQATSVTQSIQGSSSSAAKRGGLLAGLKTFFG
jgi:hypothetical protein